MATFVLFAWPLVALGIFASQGALKGLIWATLIGALFLPENFRIDLPGLPSYDKNMAVTIGILLGVLISRFTEKSAENPVPLSHQGRRTLIILTALTVISPIATVVTNPESLVFGPTFVPSLSIRDFISMMTENILFLIPLFLARSLLTSAQSHVELLRAFVILGGVYSLLVLFEARMSPQLHQWTYGYFQHVWVQHIRGGAFRPIVFLEHGLWVGIFLLTCVFAAFALVRSDKQITRVSIPPIAWGMWFLGVLFVSRNFGALALTILLLPLIWFFSARFQLFIAAVVAVFVLTYPALRHSGTIPVDRIAEAVGRISYERQESLQYRFDNEENFIARAKLKPVAGWGGWGRWRIRDEQTGQDVSVSDGRWMSILGERGWLGYIPYFGLLGLPLVLMFGVSRRRTVSRVTAGVSIIMAGTLLYQVPNNTIGPMTLLLAGALWGGLRQASPEMAAEHETPQSETEPLNPYTRFPDSRPRPTQSSERAERFVPTSKRPVHS